MQQGNSTCDCGVVPKDSYVVTYKTPKCWLSASPSNVSNPDYHRQMFCNKWGSQYPNICPTLSDREPCKEIHEPLKALDHFSIPPHINNPPICKTKYRYLKSEYNPDPCSHAAIGSKLSNPQSRRFDGIPQFRQSYKPNSSPNADSVCGLYEKSTVTTKNPSTKDNENCGSCRGNMKFSFDLPFTVSLMDPDAGRKKKVVRPTGGVARCLHPSEHHDLKTLYNLEQLDFYKMLPREKIDLYRSPLTIDKRRKKPTIQRYPEKDLVLPAGEPICVNATPVKWKSSKIIGGGKDFEVFIPNPIIIG